VPPRPVFLPASGACEIRYLCTDAVHKFTDSRAVEMWQWDDVRFFLEVSRHGSLSGAARALRVDHATVGRRIAAFEEQLGSKLFDRTPEGLAITAAGQAILRHCEAMESGAASVERLVAGHDARLSGRVRVATTEGLAHALIVPALATLAREHAQLQLEVIASPASLDITRRQADIAVRFGRPRDPDVICRKLGDCGFALYGAASQLAAPRTPDRDRSSVPTAVSYLGAPTWHSDALGGARLALLTNSPFVQLEAVARGIGIGLFPCFLGDSNPELERRSGGEPPEPRAVWMVIHRDLRRVAKIRLIADAIADAFHRNRHLLRSGSRGRRRFDLSEMRRKSDGNLCRGE
jgi:DNA-binding transcriptional LysR family regulator